ncbi:MAG TPA: MarC family protein [Thermoanaerobaculia bacterium]|nr:MarC family protein [Thermoanaerobaculia bacterium]
MPLSDVLVVSFTALITMVNPLAVVPSFVALTDGASRRGRASVALFAAMTSVVVLTTFFFAGNYVFRMFGITVPAFQIMGGIIFLSRALRTLLEDKSRASDVGGTKRIEDHDVEKAELDPSSVAIVPLGVPMLAGPGAITSVMVLVNLYPRVEQKAAVIGAILGAGLACYLVLLAAMPLSRVMGDRGRAVFAKIMALLLGAIGIQFIINGIRPVFIDILKAT